MENKAQVDVIYTDLKAAFDKIDHNIMLSKFSLRSNNQTHFVACIDGTTLRRATEFTDLGVVLDPKLTFNANYTSIIAKANRQLGFISKIAKDFTDPHCLKYLYCALVRHIVETASIVWTPNNIVWNLRIERVQRRFIRIALRHLPWRDPLKVIIE
ncbi:uncharacterized protein LOC134202158 [Armigeres subalbatus]|uniref:uncharacterized protein LOC134202158 n=1 Tax=Armigeres subalbatus TaxID=124917 RepID=UPI002ED4F7FC